MATHSNTPVPNYKFCILSHRCVCMFHLTSTNKTLIQGFRSSDVDAVSLGERFPTLRINAALTQETEWTADPWIWRGHDPSKRREPSTQRQSVIHETRALSNCDLQISIMDPILRRTRAAFTVWYTLCYCVSWRHLLMNVFQMAKLIIGIDVESS